ncbi:MAG: hypothetical protein JXB30_01295 [Anaerolineae bacterium]|nr:hypothetical protein [Anaerolineae bacterium]
MTEEPIQAESAIVGVLYANEWSWYNGPRDLWLMDWRRWAEDWGQDPDQTDYSSRFDIQVLDVDTVAFFFERMEQHHVSTSFLHTLVQNIYDYNGLQAFSISEQAELLDDLWDLIPGLLVDFDNRQLVSNFPDAEFSPGRYIPDGWVEVDANLFENVPEEHRYWIIDGRDAMAHFSAIIYQAGEIG